MSHAALKQDLQPAQNAAMKKQQSKNQNDLPVGEILRRARVHYGHSIVDVEAVLRIPAIQLEAIESGNYDALPARVYAIGFVRSYAKYLGLNSDQIVSLFKQQSINSAASPDLHFPVGAEQSNMPSKWIIIGTILALILISGMLLRGGSSSNKDKIEIPSVSEEVKNSASVDVTGESLNKDVEISMDFDRAPTASPGTTATTATPDTDTPAEQKSGAAINQSQGIVLNIIENSWVEIRNAQGKQLVSRVLKAGDQYFVPDRPGLTMSIGNAGGIEIKVDGNVLPPLGKAGSVVRNISLDVSALKKLEKER